MPDILKSQMKEKPWYLSKTVWINGLMALAGLTTLIINQQMDLHLSKEVLAIIIQAQAWVNLLLRFWTNTGIAGMPPKES